MPEYQNFYIIQHGIRLSGMPASRNSFKEEEIWQVTTFLSHMDKLPPQVSDQWKVAALEATDLRGRRMQRVHGFLQARAFLRVERRNP